MLRPRRRNPVIVADSDYLEAVAKEMLRKIKAGGGAAHVIAFNNETNSVIGRVFHSTFEN
ncbi:hypothetical protein ACMD2_17478 [Ananas comosus]|uniref:Uncharacterized protein n=1 Tax=Ananas comosus TaxID=4615 RepID=A0A199VN79_ANACO|nr:hypothetical protein ACMD2_17478 [Ananas comosus]